MLSSDPKHDRYRDVIRPDDEFWGIGVENETYMEMKDGLPVTAAFFNNHMRERYSINYWEQYKEGRVEAVLNTWISELPVGPETPVCLPLLLNGHSFTKCDRMGEHRTVYAKTLLPNPRFRGQTLWEDLQELSPVVFKEGHNHWWTFDGDTVEFMTQNFYCTTIEDVVEELVNAKQRWIGALRDGLQTLGTRCERLLQQPVDWPRANYGFATFLSNRGNVAIFNNGTYHINLTAPTRLDKNGEIADWQRFEAVHRAMARLFQWMTPFFVARFGSPDPFAHLVTSRITLDGQGFPTGSQRLIASRYVSAGIYDTVQMPRGKLLTLPTTECSLPSWWHTLHAHPGCAYKSLDHIGFDINFNKFHNHGLEFRIFDWFPESDMLDLLRLLVWFLDAATDVTEVTDAVPHPQTSAIWNTVLLRCLWEGTGAVLDVTECREFERALSLPQGTLKGPVDAYTAYTQVFEAMATLYNHRKTGCSGKMIRKALLRPIPYRGGWMSEDIKNVEHSVKHVVRVRFIKVPNWRSRSVCQVSTLTQSPHLVHVIPNEPDHRWWLGLRRIFRFPKKQRR